MPAHLTVLHPLLLRIRSQLRNIVVLHFCCVQYADQDGAVACLESVVADGAFALNGALLGGQATWAFGS